MNAKEEQAVGERQLFGFLYIANLLFSFHLFLLIYIDSSFLTTFVDEEIVGAVFLVGSTVSVAVLFLLPRILRALGNYRAMLIFAALEMLTLTGIALSPNALSVIFLFIVHVILVWLMVVNFDIFLESYSKGEGRTGAIRGAFLTITNTALILSPLIAGFVLKDGNFSIVYLLSAAFLVPFFFIILSRFRSFQDPAYENIASLKALTCIARNKNISGALISHFLLRFFFTFMVIYMPIYLHEHIGFSWPEIGIIFSIMLLPFVLFEYPLGKLADTKIGEKEIMIIGFIILIVSTGFISFFTSALLVPWAILLFLTRVGASFIEITTESYFFKHVDASDSSTISFFRITRPASYILGPLVAIAALLFIEIQYLFLLLSVILLLGIYFSLQIKDTR